MPKTTKDALAILLVLAVTVGVFGFWLYMRWQPAPVEQQVVEAAPKAESPAEPAAKKEIPPNAAAAPKAPPPVGKWIHKNPRMDIPRIGRVLASGDEDGAQMLARLVVGSGVDLEDVMEVFRPANKRKSEQGGAFTERFDVQLNKLTGKKPPTVPEIEALQQVAYETAAIAEVTHAYYHGERFERLRSSNKDKQQQSAEDFRTASRAFVKAILAKDPRRVSLVARRLETTCIRCHEYLGDTQPLQQYALERDLRKDFVKLAHFMADGRRDKADEWVEIMAWGVELEDLMKLMEPRKRGGLGFGSGPKPDTPDGIEHALINMEKRFPKEPDWEALELMAFELRAIAEIVVAKKQPNSNDRVADKWLKMALAFKKSAEEFQGAVASFDATAIRQRARQVDNACIACHTDFKDAAVELPFHLRDADTLLQRVDDGKLPVQSRIAAIQALGYRRTAAKKAIPILANHVLDENGAMGKEAAISLRALGVKDSTGRPAVDEALENEDLRLRYWFAHRMNAAENPAQGLVGIMKSPNDALRARAINLLARLGPDAKDAVAALRDMQKDESDPDLRLAASRALQAINREDNKTPLLRELGDPDPIVRGRASLGLGRMGKAVVPDLVRILNDREAKRDTRVSALSALGRIGADAKDAVPALLDALKDDDALVRTMTGAALLKIDAAAAVKAGVQRR
jgi:HEAT repeat protein